MESMWLNEAENFSVFPVNIKAKNLPQLYRSHMPLIQVRLGLPYGNALLKSEYKSLRQNTTNPKKKRQFHSVPESPLYQHRLHKMLDYRSFQKAEIYVFHQTKPAKN